MRDSFAESWFDPEGPDHASAPVFEPDFAWQEPVAWDDAQHMDVSGANVGGYPFGEAASHEIPEAAAEEFHAYPEDAMTHEPTWGSAEQYFDEAGELLLGGAGKSFDETESWGNTETAFQQSETQPMWDGGGHTFDETAEWDNAVPDPQWDGEGQTFDEEDGGITFEPVVQESETEGAMPHYFAEEQLDESADGESAEDGGTNVLIASAKWGGLEPPDESKKLRPVAKWMPPVPKSPPDKTPSEKPSPTTASPLVPRAPTAPPPAHLLARINSARKQRKEPETDDATTDKEPLTMSQRSKVPWRREERPTSRWDTQDSKDGAYSEGEAPADSPENLDPDERHADSHDGSKHTPSKKPRTTDPASHTRHAGPTSKGDDVPLTPPRQKARESAKDTAALRPSWEARGSIKEEACGEESTKSAEWHDSADSNTGWAKTSWSTETGSRKWGRESTFKGDEVPLTPPRQKAGDSGKDDPVAWSSSRETRGSVKEEASANSNYGWSKSSWTPETLDRKWKTEPTSKNDGVPRPPPRPKDRDSAKDSAVWRPSRGHGDWEREEVRAEDRRSRSQWSDSKASQNESAKKKEELDDSDFSSVAARVAALVAKGAQAMKSDGSSSRKRSKDRRESPRAESHSSKDKVGSNGDGRPEHELDGRWVHAGDHIRVRVPEAAWPSGRTFRLTMSSPECIFLQMESGVVRGRLVSRDQLTWNNGMVWHRRKQDTQSSRQTSDSRQKQKLGESNASRTGSKSRRERSQSSNRSRSGKKHSGGERESPGTKRRDRGRLDAAGLAAEWLLDELHGTSCGEDLSFGLENQASKSTRRVARRSRTGP